MAAATVSGINKGALCCRMSVSVVVPVELVLKSTDYYNYLLKTTFLYRM